MVQQGSSDRNPYELKDAKKPFHLKPRAKQPVHLKPLAKKPSHLKPLAQKPFHLKPFGKGLGQKPRGMGGTWHRQCSTSSLLGLQCSSDRVAWAWFQFHLALVQDGGDLDEDGSWWGAAWAWAPQALVFVTQCQYMRTVKSRPPKIGRAGLYKGLSRWEEPQGAQENP